MLDRLLHLTTLSIRSYRKACLKEITSYARQAVGSRVLTIPGQKKDKKNDKGGGGFTHFLSMPLPQISQETYSLWRDEIIGKKYEELPARVLINQKLLHLTLLMLPLGEAGKIENARQALRIIAPKI